MPGPAQPFSRVRRVALLLGLLAVPSAVFAESPVTPIPPQAVPAQTTDSINRPTSRPYTGDLSVFEDPERDKKLQVNRVMDLLEIHTGSAVADIGAGSGWFTVRAARRVGNSGRVYAVDINPSYLDYIRDRAQKEKLPNIHTLLGKSDDPLLPPNSVDAVLLMKTYHEVAQPIRLLRRVRAAMRPGARLGIIDRNGKGDDHGVNRDVVIDEAKRAGFALVADYDDERFRVLQNTAAGAGARVTSLTLEEIFIAANVDYGVEADEYRGRDEDLMHDRQGPVAHCK